MRLKRDRIFYRKLMLFPFMDTFFILLMFFIVVSAIRVGGEGPNKSPENNPSQTTRPEAHPVLTPKAGWGEAHILVQMLGGQTVLWFDNRGGASGTQLQISQLSGVVGDFCRAAARCKGSLLNIAIRCPDTLVYGEIQEVIDKINGGVETVSAAAGGRRIVAKLAITPGEAHDFMASGIKRAGDTLKIAFQ